MLIESDNPHLSDSGLSQHNGNLSLTVVRNPSEVFKALLSTRFKLILLDATLANPEMVGFMKSVNGLNAKTPVIVLLGAQDSHLRAYFETLDIEDCWIKPLNNERLNQMLGRQKKTEGLMPAEYVDILLDKTQNNKSLALTIFEKLFAELPQQLLEIRSALQNQQYQSALDVTHKLHGSLSFCGFTDIQQYAYNLEHSLSNQDYQAIAAGFNALKTAILNFTAKKISILDHCHFS